MANDVVERRGDGVVGDVEFLAAVLGVEREADGTGRALPNFTGEFRVNEVECGIAGLLLLDADAVERSGGVAVEAPPKIFSASGVDLAREARSRLSEMALVVRSTTSSKP